MLTDQRSGTRPRRDRIQAFDQRHAEHRPDRVAGAASPAQLVQLGGEGRQFGRIEECCKLGDCRARLTVPYSNKVRKEARGLVGMLRSGVEGVRFDTAEGEVTLRELPPAPASAPIAESVSGTYGAVTGRVQTLSSRSHLRFTLYDRLHERAVSCYVAEGRESLMREIWDKVATVEGWVTRDPTSGRPLAVRRITEVTLLNEVGPQAYRNARGALPRRPGDPSPEEAIRRIRDGG
jgi:hypothetical protein